MIANNTRTLFVLAAAVLLFAACQKAVEFKKFESDADVPRITLADAKKDFDAGKVVFIDSRAEPAFKSEHIAGALNVAFGNEEPKVDAIPKGKKIIVYCS